MQHATDTYAGSQAALRTSALVMARGFCLIMRRKKRPRTMPGQTPGRIGAKAKTGNAVAESENIVAETAEAIFADLADAQTINRDQKGAWKAPLWQALSEAGLPLAWVPEDSAVPAPAWPKVLACWRRRPFCCRGAAGRNHAGGMAAGPGQNFFARRRDDGRPASPRDRITLNADGSLSGRARGVPFAKAAKHIAVLASGASGAFDRAGRCHEMPDRGRPQSRRRQQRYRDL